MTVRINDLAFDESKDIVIRMWTSTSSTFDINGITDIDFSHPDGVRFVYANDVDSTALAFIPYSAIQQIFQEQ